MKAKMIQIRIDEDLLKELQQLADSNAISVSSQVRMLIKRAIRDGR